MRCVHNFEQSVISCMQDTMHTQF